MLQALYGTEFSEDYALYAYVNEQLSARVSAGGNSFKRALSSYREIEEDLMKIALDHHALYEFTQLDEEAFLDRYVGSEPYREIEEYLAEGP